MDAFDADVIIYANVAGHEPGARVRALLDRPSAGIGSLLLLPEVLSKPLRDGAADDVIGLSALLARLELRAVDLEVAETGTALAAKYGLRAADAIHLATAVVTGADRFITNNRRDFTDAIDEIDVIHPDGLAQLSED